MTKSYMESYYAITKDIEKLNEKYERSLTVAQGIVKGSSNVFPYTQRTFVVSGVSGKTDDDKVNAIKVQLLEMEMKRDVIYRDIEEFIDGVDDIVMRKVLHCKYVEFLSLNQIADSLRLAGYPMTRDSVKMRLNRFWKKRE